MIFQGQNCQFNFGGLSGLGIWSGSTGERTDSCQTEQPCPHLKLIGVLGQGACSWTMRCWKSTKLCSKKCITPKKLRYILSLTAPVLSKYTDGGLNFALLLTCQRNHQIWGYATTICLDTCSMGTTTAVVRSTRTMNISGKAQLQLEPLKPLQMVVFSYIGTFSIQKVLSNMDSWGNTVDGRDPALVT